MNDHKMQIEPARNGKWVKYGHLHFYSVAFGFLAGCAVSFLFMAVRIFG